MAAQPSNVSPESTNPVAQVQFPERKRITRWAKGAYGGLLAGTLFLAVEMFLLEAFGRGSIWDPVRLSASLAMGDQAVAKSVPFTADILVVGMLVHYVISIWYAVVLGLLIRKLKPGTAALAGAMYGVVLYFLHFYGLTGLYPWVANERSWIVVIPHVVFGMSAAWIYSHLHVRYLMREKGLLSEAR
jgi:hypothetical protein